MAGNGIYRVGPGYTYPEVQDAIEALIQDQGTSVFTAEQKIVISADGVYEPFSIPNGSLTPTSAARLVITSAEGIQATISGLKTPAKGGTGAEIGTGVPYVTLQRLFFRNLIRGAVFGSGADRGVVHQCTFTKCSNVGLWLYEADKALVCNSVFVDNLHGIVGTQVQGVSILGNTLFNDSGFANSTPWLIYIDLRDDNGQGVDDTGLFYLKNNVMFAQAGGCVLVYEKDVGYLRSNYNDWWSPGAGPLVEVREPQPDGTVTRDAIETLSNLRIRFGGDAQSISEEPGFIRPSSTEEDASIDLSLLSASDIVGLGKKLIASDVESYVDLTLTDTDFDGESRSSPSTIGAHEKGTKPSFYGHDLFAEDETVSDECASAATAFDRAIAQYGKAVDCWLPRVHTGFFFVRDAEYYLYAEKEGVFLSECAGSMFPLTAPLVSVTSVRVSGEDKTDASNWSADGLTFNLFLADLTGVSPYSDVEVEGTWRVWDEDSGTFDDQQVIHRWKLKDGHRTYTLPSNPKAGAPIVVTDARVKPWDSVGIRREFSTEYDAEHDVTNLVFHGAANLWENPVCNNRDGTEPLYHEMGIGWSFTGDNVNALVGDGFLFAAAGASFIGQRFAIDPNDSYVLSCYASCMDSGQTGEIGCSVEFLDEFNHSISTSGPHTLPLTGSTGDLYEWSRLGVAIANDVDSSPGFPELSTKVTTFYSGIAIPTDARTAIVKFHGGDNRIGLTCIQLERGYTVTPFCNDLDLDSITVEYETSDSKLHVPDLTVNPIRSAMNNGFLMITPLSAQIFDEDAPEASSTLSDDWPLGRTEHLPWAKTQGYNKYVKVIRPRTTTLGMPDNVAELPTPALPDDIRVTPLIITARQDTDGERFAVEVFDVNGNPYAFEDVYVEVQDRTSEFPGYLAVKEWDYYTQLGQAVTVKLDEAGSQSFLWVPPSSDDVEYRGDKPTMDTGDTHGTIETYYEIYNVNHGSPVLMDQNGATYSETGASTSEYLYGTHEAGVTRITLSDYPCVGLIDIIIDGVSYEEVFEPPLYGRQFTVDYALKQVVIDGTITSPILAEYTPRLIWKDPFYPTRIHIDRSLLDGITGDIRVLYDAKLSIIVEAIPPSTAPDASSRWMAVDAVAMHGAR